MSKKDGKWRLLIQKEGEVGTCFPKIVLIIQIEEEVETSHPKSGRRSKDLTQEENDEVRTVSPMRGQESSSKKDGERPILMLQKREESFRRKEEKEEEGRNG